MTAHVCVRVRRDGARAPARPLTATGVVRVVCRAVAELAARVVAPAPARAVLRSAQV